MKPIPQYVAYYRVSTARQGNSGLGLLSQQEAVNSFLHGNREMILSEFTEVESGKQDDRRELARAIALAKETNTKLLIAKLDRLSRSASFIFQLRDSEVDFVCCDMPEANTLTIGIMAVMAQHERELISSRTKDALRAKKEKIRQGDYRNAQPDEQGNFIYMKPDRHGKYRLGNPNGFTEEVRLKGVEAVKQKAENNPNTKKASLYIAKNLHLSIRQLRDDLNELGFKSARGNFFHHSSVAYLKKKILETI
jgi:DNA invertase Pin-like site-specific DNA recombinase